MRRRFALGAAAFLMSGTVMSGTIAMAADTPSPACLPDGAPAASASVPICLNQGSNWTEATREDFYSRDQGSQMIPLPWLQALKQSNGQPFLADSLARYGYLPNPSNHNGLPVGFTASGVTGAQTVGMTCSACHTRQIVAEGKTYRVDGGPAITDFQGLLTDLDASVGQVLATDASFNMFAASVLTGTTPDADQIATLREQVNAWYLRFHTIIEGALPSPAWGPGRLDAVGMIFNRLTGLDLGPSPSFIIADNIKKADAPVRYPFVWNAPIQDKTQWPGFADNGNDVLGLARNTGEVFGVFGTFEPRRDGLVFNFLNNNSVNFDGLDRLENLLKQIGPPKWPWLIDNNLAAQGKVIFARAAADGGCAGCHDIKPGEVRFPGVQTWATPISNVGTDTREYNVLGWTAKSGSLEGAPVPFKLQLLKETDQTFNILATSVIGSIAQQALRSGPIASGAVLLGNLNSDQKKAVHDAIGFEPTRLPPALQSLAGAYRAPSVVPQKPPLLDLKAIGLPDLTAPAAPPPPIGSYEARVLQGIWAAAPYLHNGSVPTLVELLKPPAERVAQFKIGSAYDTVNVGLAVDQTQFDAVRTTTDCSNVGSGNSRCGHDFGTKLSDPEKKALLEYLKTL